MPQPSTKAARRERNRTEAEASAAFALETFAFNGRRDGEGGQRERMWRADVITCHPSPPRRCGRRGLRPRLPPGVTGTGGLHPLHSANWATWDPPATAHPGRPSLTRSSHPKIILSLLLQLLRAQVRHGLARVSIPAADHASLEGRYRLPAPPRPPSPWRRGLTGSLP